MAATITLRAQCLCRAQTFTATVPVSSLPLKGSSCHCTSCRHVTGALRSSDAEWPGPTGDIVAAAADTSGAGADGEGPPTVLGRYAHSPRFNVLFCGRCGSGMFFEEWQTAPEEARSAPERASYLVFTGVLSAEEARPDDDDGTAGSVVLPPLVRFEDHIFVGDTVDGGAACWLRGMNGEGEPVTRIWLGGRGKSEQVPPGRSWPAVEDLPRYEVDLKAAEGDKGNVPIRCHCRGVDLVLRAGEAQGEFAEEQARGEELPFFVDPVTHKFLGSLDGCDSCRIASGSEVYNWTFALLKHISFAGASSSSPAGFPEDTAQLWAVVSERDGGGSRDPRFGTIAAYASSPDVQRYFCRRCSATLFYATDDRPEMVDVAVGLLDSPDGARAESAISWSFVQKMAWRQDMMGTWREGMLRAVEKEMEEWRIERKYPKSWRRVAQEQQEQVEQAGERE
ncbi:uncharacterized protein P884DRAFT_279569 [Thermothelomyces heterothallicus CBS 202.75]|uniref:uncharacterized protein n=1 Tax=Thermothelomyces heterothallicus CBS 202.75 TaxID=1149848 RepID=UPI003744A2EC